MELYKYCGKFVGIRTNDGQYFIGKACDYTPSQNNTPEIASISIGDIEIYENEIKSIDIVY